MGLRGQSFIHHSIWGIGEDIWLLYWLCGQRNGKVCNLSPRIIIQANIILIWSTYHDWCHHGITAYSWCACLASVFVSTIAEIPFDLLKFECWSTGNHMVAMGGSCLMLGAFMIPSVLPVAVTFRLRRVNVRWFYWGCGRSYCKISVGIGWTTW